jgi:hypothetical protein
MIERFSFYRRNPHHWDVSDRNGRIYRVRGEPGHIWLSGCGRFSKMDMVTFQSATAALAYVCDVLAAETQPPQQLEG